MIVLFGEDCYQIFNKGYIFIFLEKYTIKSALKALKMSFSLLGKLPK